MQTSWFRDKTESQGGDVVCQEVLRTTVKCVKLLDPKEWLIAKSLLVLVGVVYMDVGLTESFNQLLLIACWLHKVLISSLRTVNIFMEKKLWSEAADYHFSPHLGILKRESKKEGEDKPIYVPYFLFSSPHLLSQLKIFLFTHMPHPRFGQEEALT